MTSTVAHACVLLLADDVTVATKQEAFTYAQFHTERTTLVDAEQPFVEVQGPVINCLKSPKMSKYLETRKERLNLSHAETNQRNQHILLKT